jgi:hypothetical protein
MQVLIGFAPWIAWWVLAANNTYKEAALVALVLAVVIQLWGFLHGREPKILDLASIGWFVIIEVVAYTSSASDLGHYAQPASSAALTLIVLAVKFTDWWPDEYRRRHPSGTDERAVS